MLRFVVLVASASRSRTRPTSGKRKAEPTVEDDDILSPEQVATLLRCSVRTLEKWRREGCGPDYSKVGRRVIYTRADVKSHIASRKGSSTADFDRYRPGGR